MKKINYSRVALGTLLAAILCFMTDGFLHESLLKADWMNLMQELKIAPSEHKSCALCYFFLFELGRAFLAMYAYVLMRDRCQPGPKTAVCAALLSWAICSVTTPAEFVPLGFYSHAIWFKAAAYQLVISVVSTIVAAWTYKDNGA